MTEHGRGVSWFSGVLGTIVLVSVCGTETPARASDKKTKRRPPPTSGLAIAPPASPFVFGEDIRDGGDSRSTQPNGGRAQLDSLPTHEAEVTDDIDSLASTLGNDPVALFDYVHDHIEYTPMYGSLKSAGQTVLAERGTDWDQASLLIALLRAAGYTADYRYGVVTYDLSTLADWVGVAADRNTVLSVFSWGGIPIAEASPTQLLLRRTWVEADINGTNAVFDPAMKTYACAPPSGYEASMGYLRPSFLAGATDGASLDVDWCKDINESSIRTDLTRYATNLVDYLSETMPFASMTDVLGGRTIVPASTTVLPMAMPRAVAVADIHVATVIPDEYRATFRIRASGIDQAFHTFQIADRAIVVSHAGGVPVLKVDGEIIATGVAWPEESWLRVITASVNHPYPSDDGAYCDQMHEFSVTNSGTYVFACDFDSMSQSVIRKQNRRLRAMLYAGANPAENLEHSLWTAGSSFCHYRYLFRRMLEGTADLVAYTHHQVGLMGQRESYYIDMPMHIWSAVDTHPANDRKLAAFRVGGLMTSAFEHGILEQLKGDDSAAASSVKCIQLNNASGEKTYFIRTVDYGHAESILYNTLTNYTDNAQMELSRFIERFYNRQGGYAICPKNGQIEVGDWCGSGFIEYIGMPDLTAIYTIIEGGYNGGWVGEEGQMDPDEAELAISLMHGDPDYYAEIPSDTAADPVDMATGHFDHDHTDLALLPTGPMAPVLTRTYNSGNHLRPGPFGYGWSHNHEKHLIFHDDPLPVLGQRAPRDAAPLIAYAYVMVDVMDNGSNLVNWVTASLGSVWAMDMMSDNAITVDMGGEGYKCIATANGGRWLPPPGVDRNLAKQGDTYLFQGESRSCWQFDANGRALGHVDADGNSLLYGYAGSLLTSVSNSFGQALVFSYDGDRITTVTDHTGRSVTYEYDTTDLYRARDPLGHATTHGWTGDHLLTTVTLPEGNTTIDNVYDTSARVVRQLDGEGNQTRFEYSPFETVVHDPDGTSRSFFLDGSGRTIGREDAVGNVERMSYNGLGLPTELTDREENATRFAYDAEAVSLSEHRNAVGNTASNSYASQVLDFSLPSGGTASLDFQTLVRRDYPNGSYEAFTYDTKGRLFTRRARDGGVWTRSYSPLGQLLQQENPAGGTATFTYHPNGPRATSTDSDRGVTTYAYDALNRLTRIMHPDGSHVDRGYDAVDRLVAVTNELGDATHYTYDANGRLTHITDPADHVTRRFYNHADQVTNTLSADGIATAFEYDAVGRLRTVQHANGSATDFAYDPRGWVTNTTRAGISMGTLPNNEGIPVGMVQPLGGEVRFEVDPLGMTTNITDVIGGRYDMVRDSMGAVTAATDPLGNTVTYAYDDDGRRVAATVPVVGSNRTDWTMLGLPARRTTFAGRTSGFGYSPMGRATAVTNPIGHVWSYAYDERGRRTAITHPDGTLVQLAYDNASRLTKRTDATGHAWNLRYSHRGQVTETHGPSGGIAYRSYTPDGRLATWWNTETGVSSNTYDAAGRLVASTDPLGNVDTYAYDDLDRLTNRTDATGRSWAFEYNDEGRLVAATDALGHTTHYRYDIAGHLTNRIDRTGAVSTYAYDILGRLVRRTDPDGVAVSNTYDNAGRLVAVTRGTRTWGMRYDADGMLTANVTPGGRTTTRTLDAVGAVTAATDPLGHTQSYRYDALGRVTNTVDALGRSVTYHYDARGALERVTMPELGNALLLRNALGAITNIVDFNGRAWTFDYSPEGRRARQTDPLGQTTRFSYDASGRMAARAYADGITNNLSYDETGHITNSVFSDGLALPYAYDAAGRLVGAGALTLERDAEGAVVNTSCHGEDYGATYTPGRRLRTADYDDGTMTVTYEYDPITGLLVGVSDDLSSASVTFTYDSDARLTGVQRANGVGTVFTYDNADRLVRRRDTRGGTTVLDLQYALDAAGQLIRTDEDGTPVTGDGLVSALQPAAFDAASQRSDGGHVHDLCGRVMSDGGTVYAWDAASRLVAVSNETYRTHMTYDSLGNVLTRVRGTDTTRYHYNHAIGMAPVVCVEHDSGGSATKRYFVWSPGSRLLYTVAAAGGAHYYHFDRIGSTRCLTGAAGNVTDTYVYTPYGRLLGHKTFTGAIDANPFLFCGRAGVLCDDGDGTRYQMRARWYDAMAARFLSRDPGWPGSDDVIGLNPYQYARHNPMLYCDPLGYESLRDKVPELNPVPGTAQVVSTPPEQDGTRPPWMSTALPPWMRQHAPPTTPAVPQVSQGEAIPVMNNLQNVMNMHAQINSGAAAAVHSHSTGSGGGAYYNPVTQTGRATYSGTQNSTINSQYVSQYGEGSQHVIAAAAGNSTFQPAAGSQTTREGNQTTHIDFAQVNTPVANLVANNIIVHGPDGNTVSTHVGVGDATSTTTVSTDGSQALVSQQLTVPGANVGTTVVADPLQGQLVADTTVGVADVAGANAGAGLNLSTGSANVNAGLNVLGQQLEAGLRIDQGIPTVHVTVPLVGNLITLGGEGGILGISLW